MVTTNTISINEIELAIATKFGIRQNIIVPNISWGFNNLHECDVFVLRKTGYAVEVEIKRTKNDLLNDFKKKHGHKSNKIVEFYYAIPGEKINDWVQYIPEHAGILLYEKLKGGVIIKYHRFAIRNKTARKLTIEEQLKIARLGCMRIWGLKRGLINCIQNK